MTDHESASILIVDDDEDILSACRVLLKRRFGTVVTTADPRHIPALMAENQFDVILLDMNFRQGDHSGKEGLHWLSRIVRSTGGRGPDHGFQFRGRGRGGDEAGCS